MATRLIDLLLLFFTMLLIGVLLPVRAHAELSSVQAHAGSSLSQIESSTRHALNCR